MNRLTKARAMDTNGSNSSARTRPSSVRAGVALLATGAAFAAVACKSHEPLRYPNARFSDHVDTYHDTEVPDPYRWLEDPDSPETRAWIEAQNELSENYLSKLWDRRAIEKRLTELWNYERYGLPSRRGGRTLFTKNDGLQDQSVLYMLDDDGEPRVVLDPNTFSEDNTIALASYVLSWNGRYLAYALSDGGSDWREWRVRDIDAGVDLDDVITRNKFGNFAWAGDDRGFYYARYDAPAEGTELQAVNSTPDIAYHRLGSRAEDDRIVVARPTEEDVSLSFSLTEDKRALVVTHWNTTSGHDELILVPTDSTGEADHVVVADGFDAQYSYIGDDGNTLWIRTDLDAPLWKVIAVDRANPARENWRDLVPESEDAIQGVSAVGGKLVVTYMKDASSRVQVFELDGTPESEITLPGIGSAYGFGGELDATDAFYSFTSFTQAPTIYRYDFATGTSEVFRKPQVDFDASLYETYQVFYLSKDKHTTVPMFITHRKDIDLNGKNPTYLYGYGGFNVSLTPSFSVPNLVWLEMGGVLAIPNLRGGGEYGEDWHAAGTKLKKQNVFDDFAYAARWLIRNDYTIPGKLAIGGGSNGGLLVGACMTQEPWMYGAALPAVGVLDMLRYHKFTIGWAWARDYGTSDNKDEFLALLDYSPLHNVRPRGSYPATLITTADHDDRVVPAHSFKFAATLQANQESDNPILIRIETRAGHGSGKPTKKRIAEAADRWAFVHENLGMPQIDRLPPVIR